MQIALPDARWAVVSGARMTLRQPNLRASYFGESCLMYRFGIWLRYSCPVFMFMILKNGKHNAELRQFLGDCNLGNRIPSLLIFRGERSSLSC